MRILKRIGIFFLVLLLLLIGAMIAVPILFKDKIHDFAKETVNSSIDATVDFEDVGISFFRSFPNLNIRMKEYSVVGKEEFEGITLAAGESFDLAVNPFSIIWGPVNIKSIRLRKPVMNIHVLSNGKANYDIAASTDEPTTTTETEYKVELQSYRIDDGYISYNDQTLDLQTELAGFNHRGKGDFTMDIFNLDTDTEIEYWSLDYGGIAYLDSVNTEIEAIVKVDLPRQKYALRDNNIVLNQLEANAKGFVQLDNTGENITMDLAFNTPSNKFKDLLSILPNAYTKDFRSVKTDGTFQLDGVAEGVYNATTESYPSLLVDLQVNDGYVKYPDLAVPIKDLNVNMNVNKPEGDLDATVVDIKNFAMQVGSDPVEGYLKLKTPLSDPDIDTRINANLDLANLSKAYPMDGVRELAGRLVTDIKAKAKQSDIESENYAAVDMQGKVEARDMLYVADGMPNIDVKNALVQLSPQYTEITNFDARLGKSDMAASGKIFNPLAYLSPKETVRGEMRIRSNYFNVDEWFAEETTSSVPTSDEPPVQEEVADEINFDIDAEMKKIDYDVYNLSDLRAKAQVTMNDLQLREFFTKVNGSDVSATGQAKNIYNFAMNEGVMSGNFDLISNTFDLDKLLYPEGVETTNESTETTSEVGEAPAFRYDLDITAKVDQIIYSPYELSNFTTRGEVTEKKLTLQNFDTKIKDGDISGDGVITDYMEYVFEADTVRGTFNLNSNFLNLNSILASEEYTQNIGDDTPETAEPEDLEAYILDPKWDFKVKGKLNRVLYTDIDMRNMTGNITVNQGRLLFEDTEAAILGGKMLVTGGYDTSDPEKPNFDMKFGLEEVSFAEAFNTFNTFKILAPVGQFIDGRLNTNLLFSSVLGQDMMPDLMTIDADGFMATLNAVVRGFKPLQSVGEKLQIDLFDDFEIKDTKNWFKVEDGVVSIDDITLTKDDMTLKVSGKHGLNQDMDYKILANIPKEKLGSAANRGFSFLEGEAAKKGLNLNTGTHVNLEIKLGGSLTAPQIGIVPIGTETKDGFKTAVTDKAEEEIAEVREEVEEKVNDRIEEEKEKIETVVNETVDSVKNAAKDKVEEVAGEVGKEINKKAEEVLGDEAQKIKDRLEQYNPFKKKKKKDGNG